MELKQTFAEYGDIHVNLWLTCHSVEYIICILRYEDFVNIRVNFLLSSMIDRTKYVFTNWPSLV